MYRGYHPVLNDLNVNQELAPKYRRSIKVYDKRSGNCIVEYYNLDLNEVCKRTRNQYFIDKVPVIIRDDNGYVEHIGELKCLNHS